MAIIYSYPVITSLANDDRLIISDMDSTTGNPTKSVTLSTLKSFISGTPGAGGVSGTGTTNQIPLWTNGPSGVIGDSLLKQDVGGTEVQLGGNLSMKANDLLDVNGNTGTAGQLLSSLGTGNGVDWITVAPAIPHIINDPQAIASLFIGYNTFSGVPSFALGNLAIGIDPLKNITTGDFNVALGGVAGAALTTGSGNILVGQNAGTALLSGEYNVILGQDAGKSITDSDHCIAIGYKALELGSNSGNGFSIAIGRQALQNSGTTSAFGNIAIGNEAGQDITGTGWQNVFIGANAGLDITEGQRNVVLGFDALKADTDSNENVAIGADALLAQTAGPTASINSPRNIALGYQAGRGLTTGTNSIFIGRDAGNNTAMTGTNNVLIGDDASPTAAAANNEFTLGNSSTAVLRCQQTTITALSDQRDKTSIEDLPYGLDFVDSLQPKKFVWDNRAEFDGDGNEYFSANKGSKDIGFIAQELQTVDDEWLNLVYDSNPERLEASYGKLIPVLVKAIKELKARVEALEA